MKAIHHLSPCNKGENRATFRRAVNNAIATRSREWPCNTASTSTQVMSA